MVREDPPWWKRNPMPESLGGWRWERHKVQTKDGNWVECEGCQKCLHDNPDFPDLHVMRLGSWRHTRAHEYVFMLTKQMNYFCDQEEMREPVSGNAHAHGKGIGRKLIKFGEGVRANKDFGEATRNETAADLPKTRNPRTGIEVDDLFGEWSHFFYYVMEYAPWLVERFLKDMTNPDDVFDVPAGSYSGKHFATFPPDLIAPLMRASCPKHCCPECGNAWAPIVDPSYFNDTTTDGRPAKGNHKKLADQKIMSSGERTRLIVRTSGYAPTCDCGCETSIPGIVLDPFAGSGTTGMVAKELGRRWIAMDISEPYLDLQARLRTKWGEQKTKIDDLPLFSDLEGA